MLATKRGQELLAEAWGCYDDAIELLEQGDLRNAAGKAWDASEKATNALIVERTGREPQFVREMSSEVAHLGQESQALAPLRSRFAGQVESLYGDCFIDGNCSSGDYHVEMIRNTAGYIRDAERLADAKA